MHRRQLLAGASALVSAAALGAIAGCSSIATGTATVPVTLAGAQAETQAILASLETAVSMLGAGAPPVLQTALVAARGAVAAFVGLPASASATQTAIAAVQAIAAVVAQLTLSPAAALAITAGLALVNGLVVGSQSVTVPASVLANAPVGVLPGRIAAPIPIPMLPSIATPSAR